MPNWCYNSLTIEGEQNEINKFKEFAKKDDRVLETTNFIPFPPEREEMNKEHNEWIKTHPKNQSWDGPKDWFNRGGYEWCCVNWGTKWGICHSSINTESEGSIQYDFDSAWSPPEPVIIKMGQMFPNLKFSLYFEEPGCAFKGTLVVDNGEITEQTCEDYIYDEEDDEEAIII